MARKGISDVRDVASEIWKGDAPCGQLPHDLGGWGKDEVRSCADVECREICDEGLGERWCEGGQLWRGRIHGGRRVQTRVYKEQ